MDPRSNDRELARGEIPSAPPPLLWRYTIVAGIVLGLGLGLGLGAVSGDYRYYIVKEVTLGLIAGLAAPLFVPLTRRLLPDRRGARHDVRRYLSYFVAGAAAGLVVMAVNALFPLHRPLLDPANLLYLIGVAGAMPLIGVIADAVYAERLVAEQERAERTRTRAVLGQYVSEPIAGEILSAPDPTARAGEKRVATVLISDIRGFTRMLQEQGAEQVVLTLNAYFTRMIDVIAEYDGTVNKFIGDAIVVLYNAPLAQPDANQRALNTARAMLQAGKVLNAERAAQQLPPIRMGIAIDTGEVICGNVGSPKRLEYTAIGAPVNTAYQLAGLAPAETIYLTENVFRALDGNVNAVPARAIELKGDTGTLQVYTLTPA